MKVGYVLEQFPCYTDTAILSEMLELEAQGVELHIFSLHAPGDQPRHAEMDDLLAECTQAAWLGPASIARHLEAQVKSGSAEAREEAEFLSSLVDERVPWRNEALSLAALLTPKAEELGITHFHAHRCSLATATAQELSRLMGLPFSFSVHAEDFARPEVTPQRLAEWIQAASFTVTDCKTNAREIAERCGARAARGVRVIYKGLDLPRWNVRASGPRQTDFIAVGPLEARKGFDDYLAACSLLRERGHQFRALLVGTGPDEARLKLLARRLGLGESLEFAGPMTQDELRRRMVRSAALIAPCVETAEGERNGTPMAILEAMAVGVPPITTSVGGIPEMVEDPRSGWLVPPRDTEALARAMRRAMKHGDEATRRGEGARRRVAERFNIETNISCLARMMYRSSRRKVANQTRTEDYVASPA